MDSFNFYLVLISLLQKRVEELAETESQYDECPFTGFPLKEESPQTSPTLCGNDGALHASRVAPFGE